MSDTEDEDPPEERLCNYRIGEIDQVVDTSGNRSISFSIWFDDNKEANENNKGYTRVFLPYGLIFKGKEALIETANRCPAELSPVYFGKKRMEEYSYFSRMLQDAVKLSQRRKMEEVQWTQHFFTVPQPVIIRVFDSDIFVGDDSRVKISLTEAGLLALNDLSSDQIKQLDPKGVRIKFVSNNKIHLKTDYSTSVGDAIVLLDEYIQKGTRAFGEIFWYFVWVMIDSGNLSHPKTGHFMTPVFTSFTVDTGKGLLLLLARIYLESTGEILNEPGLDTGITAAKMSEKRQLSVVAMDEIADGLAGRKSVREGVMSNWTGHTSNNTANTQDTTSYYALLISTNLDRQGMEDFLQNNQKYLDKMLFLHMGESTIAQRNPGIGDFMTDLIDLTNRIKQYKPVLQAFGLMAKIGQLRESNLHFRIAVDGRFEKCANNRLKKNVEQLANFYDLVLSSAKEKGLPLDELDDMNKISYESVMVEGYNIPHPAASETVVMRALLDVDNKTFSTMRPMVNKGPMLRTRDRNVRITYNALCAEFPRMLRFKRWLSSSYVIKSSPPLARARQVSACIRRSKDNADVFDQLYRRILLTGEEAGMTAEDGQAWTQGDPADLEDLVHQANTKTKEATGETEKKKEKKKKERERRRIEEEDEEEEAEKKKEKKKKEHERRRIEEEDEEEEAERKKEKKKKKREKRRIEEEEEERKMQEEEEERKMQEEEAERKKKKKKCEESNEKEEEEDQENCEMAKNIECEGKKGDGVENENEEKREEEEDNDKNENEEKGEDQNEVENEDGEKQKEKEDENEVEQNDEDVNEVENEEEKEKNEKEDVNEVENEDEKKQKEKEDENEVENEVENKDEEKQKEKEDENEVVNEVEQNDEDKNEDEEKQKEKEDENEVEQNDEDENEKIGKLTNQRGRKKKQEGKEEQNDQKIPRQSKRKREQAGRLEVKTRSKSKK